MGRSIMETRHKETGHIISHTHWDREWRVPIWHARLRLIRMIDSLLDFLDDNKEFNHFVFDGQVVGIEDYLEFRPEKKKQVLEAIKNGRIDIGPWYNLPDEYPAYGETLVRNLLTGVERTTEMANCLDIAYTTFGWGQTAQFPQIFKGFGIDFVVVGKHVSKARAPESEFIWASPDGTEIMATRLGESSRANLFFTVIMPPSYGVNYHDRECRIKWGQGGWQWRDANRDVRAEMTCIPEFDYHNELLPEALNDAWNSTNDTLVKTHGFMGNGCDSTGPADFLAKLISDANETDANKELKLSGLKEYADKAWHYLLLAHSHDAINGVTLDKTSDDTAYKLKQIIELAMVVTDMSAIHILQNVNLKQFNSQSILLAVFDNSSLTLNKIVHAIIDVPEELSPRWMTVKDGKGNELAVQPVDHNWQASPACVQNSRALPFYCDRHEMYLATGDIPPFGYKILELTPEGKYDRKVQFWENVFDYGSQVTGPNRLANKYLEVLIYSDGTLNLQHRATGRTYENMHYFEDSGDIGDYWQRVEPAHNRVYTSSGFVANIYQESIL